MGRSTACATRPDWASKTLAGLLLGLGLSLIASAILSQLTLDIALPVRGQLAMWLVPPIWLGVLSGVYFFSSGLRAWLWLAAADAVAYSTLLALRWLS